MAGTDDTKFVPRFAMPVIASAPPGYSGDAAAYYAELATQTTVTPTLVEVLPERLLQPTGVLDKNGLLVTITNPDATFTPATPITGTGSVLAPLPTFGTLFALTGGMLFYRRSTALDGLSSLLWPPYDGIQPPVEYPAPAGLVTPTWGTLALVTWGPDFDVLQTALSDHTACATVYYVGVDEASLQPLLKPTLQRIFPKQPFLDYVAGQAQQPPAKQKKAVLRDVGEATTGTFYPTAITAPTPDYDQIIDDILVAFLNSTASILVEGGMPIGKAVQCSAGITPDQTVAQVELWFADAAPQFISPVWVITGAPTYDF